ncbi:MAG: exodeoxyribonuclease VII small subunit [Planctomycetes bacterium]|nr:exodeoxyribonuclease VII small subunit [Planctomycetota bacterium]
MSAKKKDTPDEQPLPGFEASLAQLEAIIEAIESGDVTLEESLERYGQGMKLITHCRSVLDRAESKIKELTLTADGKIAETEGA